MSTLRAVISKDSNVKTTDEELKEYSYKNQVENEQIANKSAAVSQLALIKKAGLDLARQSITFATSNYGNITGDYVAQAKIDMAVKGITSAISVVGASIVNPALGLALIGSMAIDYGFSELSRSIELRKSQLQSDHLKQRCGLYGGKGR